MNPDRASATARLIAAANVMREGSRGGSAPAGAAAWCERFLSTARNDRLLLWSVRSALGRAWWRVAEAACLPGVVSHWMRRKREIDRLARHAAAEGFSQLIVLGAGLDALAFRLDREKLFNRILSADHPATLAVVRSALCLAETSGEMENRGVELLDLDLNRDDVWRALTASRTFDAGQATVVVIEGLLMYFPETTVAQIFSALAALPSPTLRVIASWMVAEPGQDAGFRGQSSVVRGWLSRRSEPMLWASTPLELRALLAECGWSDARFIDLSEADSAAGTIAHGLSSEQLVVAERREANKPPRARREWLDAQTK